MLVDVVFLSLVNGDFCKTYGKTVSNVCLGLTKKQVFPSDTELLKFMEIEWLA